MIFFIKYSPYQKIYLKTRHMAQVKTAVKNQRRVLSKFTKKRYWSPR